MNWYKKSQQSTFEFMDKVPKSNYNIEETEEYQKLTKQTPKIFKNLVERCTSLKELVNYLKIYGFQFTKINDIIAVQIDGQSYIVNDSLEITEGDEWIWSINDWDLDNYVKNIDFNKRFWDNPEVVYHATTPERAEIVFKNGLFPQNKTRGIENRTTGSAIFTSNNPYDINAYGDVIIEINTLEMKRDGYMPYVSLEEPIESAKQRESLANMIGLYDFSVDVESGISPNTIIFYDDIPTKYLKRGKNEF